MTAVATLADRLREATREAHHRAEGSRFVGRLVAGELPVTAYAALVANHRAIYAALEDVPPTWVDDPVAGPFVRLVGLPRGAALQADLADLGVADPDRLVAAATHRYTDWIRTSVATGRTDRWLAHHYVRYLGDVSGGQVVARAVRAHHGTTATAFYDFTALGPIPPFRTRYRALLAAAPVPDAEAVVHEAVAAFDHNRAIFEELDRTT